MSRAWTGVLTVEGRQTGDGRLIVDNALAQAPFPQPLGWLQQEQHGDLVAGAVTVGTIEFAERQANGLVVGGGQIDDGDPNGAEVLRRLDAAVAPGGSSWGISIDPDDWIMEIVDTQAGLDVTEPGGDELLDARARVVTTMRGSGGKFADFRVQHGIVAELVRALGISSLTAAAGDPMPDGGELLFTDASDGIIARFTRLRQRGATLVAIPAFDEAKISLEQGEPAPAPPVTSGSTLQLARSTPTLKPRGDWFENPNFEEATRLTIGPVDDVSGLRPVFGHVATWGTCHKGYTDRCVPPPRGDDHGDFRQGRVTCDDGLDARTGVLTWGIPHADLTLPMIQAQDHYASSRYGWADVVSGEDRFGIWFSGAVRPNITDADVYILRALSISGDWRWSVRERKLKLIAALAVNYPGFPIAASSGSTSAIGPQVLFDGERPTALVAAGVVDCEPRSQAEVDLEYVLAELARLDRRTNHLRSPRAKMLVEKMRQKSRARELVESMLAPRNG